MHSRLGGRRRNPPPQQKKKKEGPYPPHPPAKERGSLTRHACSFISDDVSSVGKTTDIGDVSSSCSPNTITSGAVSSKSLHSGLIHPFKISSSLSRVGIRPAQLKVQFQTETRGGGGCTSAPRPGLHLRGCVCVFF